MDIRVLVVDDEPIAAQATALMVGQAGGGIGVAGVCHSGREAIQSAASLKPDLIIMDIQMPGINGLEAMRRIKQENPATQFIILSAYSEFSYAIQALNLGAADYLLKPVRQDDLNASLEKIAADLRSRKNEWDRELQQRERLEIALPMIKKDFIRALAPGANTDEKLVACAAILGFADKSGFMLALACEGDDGLEAMRSVLERIAFNRVELVYDLIGPRQMAAYLPLPDGAAPGGYAADVRAQLEKQLNQQRETGFLLRAGYSGFAREAEGLKLMLRQALCALAHAAPGGGLAFNPETMALDAGAGTGPDAWPPKGETGTAGKIIDRALQFIGDNYARDITLDEIAAHTNLSPYYFSRLFKEATGSNFSERLTSVRIDHARELLATTDASVKDVAFQVGFNDPNYFSKVFHKITGIKASGYRAAHGTPRQGQNPE